MFAAMLASTLCSCPPSDVIVVGRDVDTLQAAIDLAADGDVIVVHYETSPWATVAGKGLSIVAAPGSKPAIQHLTITNVPAHSAVHVRGLFQGTTNNPAAWISLTSCAGPVVLEDLRTGRESRLALDAVDCASVQVVTSELGSGYPIAGLAPTVRVRSSRLDVYDSTVLGGQGVEGFGCGFCTWCTDGGPGSNAIEGYASSAVRLSGCTVKRGRGGDPYPASLCQSGPDGSALVGDGTTHFDLVDMVIVGNISASASSFAGVAGSIRVPHHVGGQSSAHVTASGAPGDAVVLLQAPRSGAFVLAPEVGMLGLARAGFERRFLGTLDAQGALEVDIDLPTSDFGGIETSVVQPLFVAPSGALRLGAPRPLLHVGDRGPVVAAGRTVRVDVSATPGGDGASWASAYHDLDVVLWNAWSLRGAPPVTVWVVAGRYVTPLALTGYRAYMVPRGVRLLGGFTTTMGSESERDPVAHPTVLTGDVLGDDGPGFTNRGDNAGWLLWTRATDYATLASPASTAPSLPRIEIDGFTCSGVRQAPQFPPPFQIGDDVRLTRMTMTDNEVLGGRSLLEVRLSRLAYEADPSLGLPLVDGLIAFGNIGPVLGTIGDDYLVPALPIRVWNALIVGNRASAPIVHARAGAAAFENVTIAHNRVSVGVRALFHAPTLPAQGTTVLHSIVFGNRSSAGGGLAAQLGATAAGAAGLRCDLSLVEGWDGVTFAGAGTLGADPLFQDPLGADGVPGTGDEDYRLRAGSPGVDSGDSARVDPGATLDVALQPRVVDDPATMNTGPGAAPHVDRGAFERQP